MRVPLSWLRQLVEVELSPEVLADRLTLLGMEVSAIETIGADWQRVVVGELLEVGPHPGSSRLSLTRVRVGASEPELRIATDPAADYQALVTVLAAADAAGMQRIRFEQR